MRSCGENVWKFRDVIDCANKWVVPENFDESLPHVVAIEHGEESSKVGVQREQCCVAALGGERAW